MALDETLERLSASGPPALGSTLAWSAALVSALIQMSGSGEARELAEEARPRLLEMAEEDARLYRRFIVSEEAARLELYEEITSSPLAIARLALRLSTVATRCPPAHDGVAADLAGASRLLAAIAREAARLARVNARAGGAAFAELESEAERLMEDATDAVEVSNLEDSE